MTAGHRLLSPSGKRLLSSSGKLLLSDGAGNECCCGESLPPWPSSCTSVKIKTLAFAGVQFITGCRVTAGGTSTDFIEGTINGTYSDERQFGNDGASQCWTRFEFTPSTKFKRDIHPSSTSCLGSFSTRINDAYAAFLIKKTTNTMSCYITDNNPSCGIFGFLDAPILPDKTVVAANALTSDWQDVDSDVADILRSAGSDMYKAAGYGGTLVMQLQW